MSTNNTVHRKLTLTEIRNLLDTGGIARVWKEVVKAQKPEFRFLFGVDKLAESLTGSYRLTINGVMEGVYLVKQGEQAHWRRESLFPAIRPHPERAGNVAWQGDPSFECSSSLEEMDIDSFVEFCWQEVRQRNVTFYTSPDQFEQFCHEAEQVFQEYHHDNLCFRMIPDIWFDDMALVRFICEQMAPHPAMKPWFGTSRFPVDHDIWYSFRFWS